MIKPVIYVALGLALGAGNVYWDNVLFWCVMALMVVNEILAKREGVADGVMIALDMTDDQLNSLRRQLDEIGEGK
jgi:hypothetical protein